MTLRLSLLLATTVAAPALAQTASVPPAPPSPRRAAPPAVAVDAKVSAIQTRALDDDVAYGIVQGLTTEVGQRLDGTEAEGRARTWAVAKLKSLGFRNVHVEPYTLADVWERGAESAEVIAPVPQRLRLVGLGNSGATPAEGLTLPVAYFRTFNDLQLAPDGSLKGKIAFVSNQMRATQDGSSYGAFGTARFVGPDLAARKGAAAIVIRSIGTDHGRGPHAGTTNFTPGTTPIPAAALSVADAETLERLAQAGPVTLHLTLLERRVGARESGNVVAEVPGTDPKAGIVLVGGHLDSWDLGTGAIDDASGVAITTAAAKLAMEAGRHRRTIRVVWFSDEETGGFGGEAYARAHPAERHATASESDFGADRVWKFDVSLPAGAEAVGDRLQSALAPLGIVRGHDQAGRGTDVEPIIAAQHLAGIDMDQDGLRYFDYHHTPEDTLDRVDPEQLRQNVAAWATMLAIVADAPEELGPITR